MFECIILENYIYFSPFFTSVGLKDEEKPRETKKKNKKGKKSGNESESKIAQPEGHFLWTNPWWRSLILGPKVQESDISENRALQLILTCLKEIGQKNKGVNMCLIS